MNLLVVLLSALQFVFDHYAGAKTRRYFVQELRAKGEKVEVGGEKYPVRMVDVVKTFIAILAEPSSNSMIEAEGDLSHVCDYEFPTEWWSLAKARKVFRSQRAIAMCSPVFEILADDSWNVLAPDTVSAFFKSFNNDQGKYDYVIALSKVPPFFNEVTTLSQFKALCYGDKRMMEYNESGVIDDLVAQVVGISIGDVDPETCATFERASERTVARWLMSEDKSQSKSTKDEQ